MASVGQFFLAVYGSKKAKIGQYIGFRLFTWKVVTGFSRNLIYKLDGAIYVGV